jgi:hypothetical protein
MSTIEIPLSRGLFTTVDSADAALVLGRSWYAKPGRYTHYAATYMGGTCVHMHRLLLGLTDRRIFCDHIDGDGLNNRRANLRPCTHAENMRKRVSIRSSGLPRGVWAAGRGFAARIVCDGVDHYLGSFKTASEAGAAYQRAAEELFGKFAPSQGDRREPTCLPLSCDA